MTYSSNPHDSTVLKVSNQGITNWRPSVQVQGTSFRGHFAIKLLYGGRKEGAVSEVIPCRSSEVQKLFLFLSNLTSVCGRQEQRGMGKKLKNILGSY